MSHSSIFLKKLTLWCIPLTFMLAGTGMLILLIVRNASGDFYTRLQSESDAWIIAHIVLLAGSITLLPASLGLRSLIQGRRTGLVATAMVPIVAITAALLSGQYAIDFLMPEISRLGGEAYDVHKFMSGDGLTHTLFYLLPELASLAMLIMSIALIADGRLGKKVALLLMFNWIFIILGNLISPIFQRTFLFLLGITFILVLLKLKNKSPL